MHSCTSTSPVDMVQAKNSYSIHIALQKGPNHAHSPAEGPQTWPCRRAPDMGQYTHSTVYIHSTAQYTHSPAEGPQTWDIAPTSNALWTQAASMVIQAMLNLL